MAMRTVVYLRVSTGGQDLGQQKLAILEYARQHRITVDDVVEVHSSTKRTTQRAHVLARIEALSPGDRLIVSELSRLGRSLGQILQMVDALVQKGVRLIAMKEAIRLEGTQTLQTKALLTLCGLFAEIERDLIAERPKEGLIAAKAKGKRLGRPKGALGKSKLDGKEPEIQLLLRKHVSKASIARIVEVSPTTLQHVIHTRKLQSTPGARG
jgi:DNA invertase Pin-like site-specific DNA recombinase